MSRENNGVPTDEKTSTSLVTNVPVLIELCHLHLL